MNSMTWIEINRSNLEHNILQYKKWLPEQTKLAPVIKANAYGHGLYQIASIYDTNPHVATLCVVNSQEALYLRKHSIKKPILIVGYLNSSLDEVILQDITITVYDLQTIKQLQSAAKQLNKLVNIHLKVDTGMSRLGIQENNIKSYLDYIQSCQNLILQGVFSHLSNGNSPKIVHQQEELFKLYNVKTSQRHIGNSLGSLNSKYQYDLARIGIGLYGYLLTTDHKKQEVLKPVLSLKTKIIEIKELSANKTIGYFQRYKTTQKTKIAILSIGYYDGLNSKLAQQGRVLVNGCFAKIISINMNLTTIDITDIANCSVHDTVTILGEDQGANINAYEWQKVLNLNLRESFARLDYSIPRIITKQKQQAAIAKDDFQSIEL